ncbi:lipid A deacylase LpxR family protein [Coraliomargarita parva]|uniref:lipid A deacylase LpxR family protein n=1 Tax=Coraliomargarita parva TaxID=3014050 RepID=UPI0022B4BEA9|nr:lipid A deacylase LpxR family protein [Coraliomargarita parva]
MKISACAALLCSLLPLHNLAASEAPEPNWQIIGQWDNDLLTGTDRDYTNGARVGFIREFAPDEEMHGSLLNSLYRLSGASDMIPFQQWRLSGEGELRFAWGFGLSQLMFTPDNDEVDQAPKGERPYAGWLGLETSLHVKDDVSVSSVTLTLGTTGDLSYADDTQKWVHENISNSPIYQGWKSQVPAEPTLNLHLDHKQRLSALDFSEDWPLQLDGYTEWGGALGNFRTDAYLGALIRFGYNLPATYSTPRVQVGSYGHELFRQEAPDAAPLSIISFGGLRGYAVLHDITLDGPLFRDYDGAVDSKPLVGECIFGLGLRYGSAELMFSHTIRTDEFKGQVSNQEFGSVTLRFQLPF